MNFRTTSRMSSRCASWSLPTGTPPPLTRTMSAPWSTGYESRPAGSSYILSVEPRTNNKLLYRGRIWVDAEDFAVKRIEGAPAKNPSFWTKETKIVQVYTKVGDFWLPASNRSTSAIRLGGQANFTIDYQNYQITAATAVGTPDKLAGADGATSNRKSGQSCSIVKNYVQK